MMQGYYNGGGNWFAMVTMIVLVLGAILALAVWAFRTTGGPTQGSNLAMDALRQRLASGQVSQEEFDKTKKAIQG